MKYRSDIDGLRAIAVLPVVFFHFNLTRYLPGGFVGVDIFFVISGYLITKVLHDEIGNDSYRITTFYSRRVRRIFPALFAMLGFCLCWTLVGGFPPDIKTLGAGIVSAIFSYSNVLFYHSSGYFSEKIQLNPLLHTWSLAVEEQFYLLFPLLLVALRRRSHWSRCGVVATLALLSFAWAVWMLGRDPSAAFYLVPSRAWELMVGALLAMGAVPLLRSQLQAEAFGISGLLLIAASMYFTRQSTPFPGAAALAPCIGAGLLIYSASSHQTVAAKLLALAPLRFVGLISYSLYIWHWPILVFYRETVHAPLTLEKISLILVCLVIATLSWRFIERPFRTSRHVVSPRRSLGVAAVSMVLVSSLAIGAQMANANGSALTRRVNTTLAYVDYDPTVPMRVGTCFLTSGSDDADLFKRDICLKQSADKPNVLIIGDSHAADLWRGLADTYPRVNLMQATASGCKPVLDPTGEARCTRVMNYVFRQFLPHTHLDAIVLSARWVDHDVADVARTAQALAPYASRVVVLGPNAEYDELLPRLLARSLYSNQPQLVTRHLLRAQAITDKLLATAVHGAGVSYVSVYNTLCQKDCATWADPGTDSPIMFDTDHFTTAGASLLAQRMGMKSLGLDQEPAPARVTTILSVR